MSGPGGAWWEGPGPSQGSTLKVGRTAQVPLPWTWEIVSEGGKAGAQRSPKGYRAAEEAWAAGRAALADPGRRGEPALTAEQRAEITRKAAAKRRGTG